MEPVGIGGAFGWLSAGPARRGVLLCGTLGFEQHSAHRWWRDLAEGIAAGGSSVLRFDYPGEGDSEGAAAGLGTALGAIRRGVRFLREEVGAEEIVLVGLRFGGTLAALVAAEEAIDRLVLLAPFAKGRSYLREMEMQGRLIDIVPDGAPLAKPQGQLSVGGFTLAPELRRDVAPIDLRRLARAPAPRILLLGPDPAGLAVLYAEQGSHVETGDLPGLSALLTEALTTRMPDAPRARILGFVAEGMRPAPDEAPLTQSPRGVVISGEGWSEDPARFGAGLFGIHCRPAAATARALSADRDGAATAEGAPHERSRAACDGKPIGHHAPRPAVLFVNMGANEHAGYGRQATTLARALARNGVPSLRMDLAGVGDSADRLDGGLPLYRLDAVEDVRAAVTWLAAPEGRPVVVVGTCNGAYLAFHALCRDERIAAGILVNLYCFDWELSHGGAPYGADAVRHSSAYAAMLLKGATWRRILGGTTPVRAIALNLLRRGAGRLRTALTAALPTGLRLESRTGQQVPSIAERIAGLRRRGARVVMLYSEGDLGLIDLKTQLGSLDRASSRLGEPVQVVAGADHSFAAPPAQDRLLAELLRVAQACGQDRFAALPAETERHRQAVVPAPSPVPPLAA